jgi:hypothetical protein
MLFYFILFYFIIGLMVVEGVAPVHTVANMIPVAILFLR